MAIPSSISQNPPSLLGLPVLFPCWSTVFYSTTNQRDVYRVTSPITECPITCEPHVLAFSLLLLGCVQLYLVTVFIFGLVFFINLLESINMLPLVCMFLAC